MLNRIDKNELIKKVKEIHPGWSDAGVVVYSNDLLQNCDERFEGFIIKYIEEGTEMDYGFGEFSLKEIKGIMKTDYIDAIISMTEYINNPTKGKRNIFRPVFDRR